jgi:hypothetical protein
VQQSVEIKPTDVSTDNVLGSEEVPQPYTTIPAPLGSKHGLSTFNRSEAMLEKSHGLLTHYYNLGCGDEFANALLQRGSVEYNVTARQQHEEAIG